MEENLQEPTESQLLCILRQKQNSRGEGGLHRGRKIKIAFHVVTEVQKPWHH